MTREIPDLSVHVLKDCELLQNLRGHENICPRLILIDEAYAAANTSKVSLLQNVFTDSSLCLTFNGDYNSKHHIRELMKLGIIQNVLPMNLRLDLWLFAVQLLLHGGSYMPPDLLELLEMDRNLQIEKERKAFRGSSSSGEHDFDALTSRELEVLGLIAQGLQNKNIAASLQVSEHTVKLHIHHIIKKMHVSNRTEAAAAFIQKYDPPDAGQLDF